LIADDDPLYIGRPGTIAQRGANFAVQNCDYLLSIGARQDRVVTGFSPAGFAREAYKVMVDIDPAELAKMDGVIHTPVCADAGDFMREMLAQKYKIIRKTRADWKQRCADWRTRYPLVLPEHKAQGRVSVYNFAEVMSGELERPPGAFDAGRIDTAGEVTGAAPGERRTRHDIGKHRRRRDLPFEVRIGAKNVADVIHGRLVALDLPAGMARGRAVEHEILRQDFPHPLRPIAVPAIDPAFRIPFHRKRPIQRSLVTFRHTHVHKRAPS